MASISLNDRTQGRIVTAGGTVDLASLNAALANTPFRVTVLDPAR